MNANTPKNPALIEMARVAAASDKLTTAQRRTAEEVVDLLKTNRPWRKLMAGERGNVAKLYRLATAD